MKETIRIQNIILDFKNNFLSSYLCTFLYPICNDIKKQIQDIDKNLQELEKDNSEKYKSLTNEREKLLERQKSFIEEIKKELEKSKSKIIQTLTDELKNIEMQISIKTTLGDSNTVEEKLKDLKNAKELCEIYLDKLTEKYNSSEISKNPQNLEPPTQQKEPEESENPVNSIIDEIKETEKAQKSVTPSSQENFSNPPDYDITDDMNGTISTVRYSTPQNSIRSENLDFEIIDDMEQPDKNEEDTQEKESIGKDINIYISEKNGFVQYTDKEGKKLELSISSIKEEKPNTYKRIPIHKICKKIAGNRIQGAYLSHKINPILIKILDSTGNNQMIYDYIESIHNHQSLPFNLYHDLSGLTEIEKWKLRSFTKSEEKSGAEIIEHSEMKLLFEQKSKKTKTNFIPKADGNQEKIAENYNNEQKRPIEDLLNALDASPSCKMAIADYISKFGEEKARIRYKKQFAQAEAKLSIQGFIDNQSTR